MNDSAEKVDFLDDEWAPESIFEHFAALGDIFEEEEDDE